MTNDKFKEMYKSLTGKEAIDNVKASYYGVPALVVWAPNKITFVMTEQDYKSVNKMRDEVIDGIQDHMYSEVHQHVYAKLSGRKHRKPRRATWTTI